MGWLDTSGFVRAALERLNRPSILALLQQVTSELDAHCRKLESAVEPSVLTLRQELGQQAEVLRGALDQQERELSAIGCTLRSLLEQHQQRLASLLSEVEVRECQQQLAALHLQLERVQAEAETLSEVERQQVEQLLQKALQVYDVATVNLNLKVGGSGARLRLDELLQILAGVGQLAQTDFLYQQGQEGRLSGARLLLTDETVVLFDCARHELPGSIFELVFTTASWKGLPASFRIRFAKQSHQLPMCKRALTLDQYEVLYTTNIVFDLTVRAPEPAVIEPERKVEPEPVPEPAGKPVTPPPVAKREREVEILNGSFEQGPVPGRLLSLRAGPDQLPGWVIGGQGVDYIGTLWQPGDSQQRSLDLNTSGPGSIQQTIKTVPGATYRVTFMMAGNPKAGQPPETKTLKVHATGSSEALFSFSVWRKSLGAMGWVMKTYLFTATSDKTVLKFQSTTPGAAGPAIDNVRIDKM